MTPSPAAGRGSSRGRRCRVRHEAAPSGSRSATRNGPRSGTAKPAGSAFIWPARRERGCGGADKQRGRSRCGEQGDAQGQDGSRGTQSGRLPRTREPPTPSYIDPGAFPERVTRMTPASTGRTRTCSGSCGPRRRSRGRRSSLFRRSSESPSRWKPDLPTLTLLRAMPELVVRVVQVRMPEVADRAREDLVDGVRHVQARTAMTVCGSTVRSSSSSGCSRPASRT